MICPCECGEADLADGVAEADFAMVLVASVRRCPACGSSRFFVEPRRITGKPVRLSDVDGRLVAMVEALGDLTEVDPPSRGAFAVRDGVQLADVVELDGALAWRLLPPLETR